MKVSISIALIAVCTLVLDNSCAAEAQPNIVIILADDMGYGDCTANNPDSKIPTPHLDQLAKEGLRFTDAHSASGTCTPSRYGLLTGVTPAHTGVRNTLLAKGKPIIADDETTIATLLRDQGYHTAMVGKWHLGFEMDMSGRRKAFDFSKPLTGGPLDRGFDTFFGIHSSAGAAPYFFIRGRHPVAKPSQPIAESPKGVDYRMDWAKGDAAPGYQLEAVAPKLCDEAVRVIADHAASKQDKPLFLYYALSSPHSPWLPAKEFQGKSQAGLYGDFVAQLDAEVGRVHAALKESDLHENTLLIFTSDNGAMWKEEDIQKHGHRAMGDLRGHKAQGYEGGHRVPFIATWPANIPASSVAETTINFTDVFATMAELAGVDGEATYPGPTRDSHSFLTVLSHPDKRRPRPPMVNTLDCIRIDDWKLIYSQRGKGPNAKDPTGFELYNLAHDLSEETNQASTNPEQLDRLFKEYRAFIQGRELK
jgi:arylsulfatase A